MKGGDDGNGQKRPEAWKSHYKPGEGRRQQGQGKSVEIWMMGHGDEQGRRGVKNRKNGKRCQKGSISRQRKANQLESDAGTETEWSRILEMKTQVQMGQEWPQVQRACGGRNLAVGTGVGKKTKARTAGRGV